MARSIAIFGMIVHHFEIAMVSDSHDLSWRSRLMKVFDGRPAALFMILAGIGITLYSKRAVASADPAEISQVARQFRKRGLLLFILGFLNLVIWTGDILRVYGVSRVLASYSFRQKNRWLISASLFFVVGFIALLLSMNYEWNWDWSTMTYHRLWTPSGMVRNLFFDGFRSVFPWCAFVCFGMWLGRKDLRDRSVNSRCLIIGLSVMLIAEVTSAICVSSLSTDPKDLTTNEARLDQSKDFLNRFNQESITVRSAAEAELLVLVGTDSMPPLPLFLAAAGGFAVFMIALCVRIAERWPQSLIVTSLSVTGQMALTWYVAHIYIGLGTLVIFDAIGNQTLGMALCCGVGFFLFAVCVSWFWKQRFKSGPLEAAMRAMAG